LNSEVRNSDGTWSQIRKRNEAFDLLAYCEAGCLRLGVDKIDWNSAPEWARTITENSDKIMREDRREMQANTIIAQPAAERPTPESAPASRTSTGTRRSRGSSYLS